MFNWASLLNFLFSLCPLCSAGINQFTQSVLALISWFFASVFPISTFPSRFIFNFLIFVPDFLFLDSLENWAASRDAAICSICPLLLFDSWLHALSTSQTLKCAEIWPKIFWLSQFVLDKFLGNNQLQNFFQSSSSDSNLNEVMIPCQELFSSSTTSSSISRRTTQVFFPDPISSKSLKRSLATSGPSRNWKRTR